tara:strand:+ start:11604 stop:12758 length:1155 start_codon:yes stop_codon:yes gene_type:complete
MKKLLLLLLILPTVFAAQYIASEQITLEEGESIVMAGRNITLLDVLSETEIRVGVEDNWKLLSLNETKSIDKVNITVNATLYVSEKKTNYATLLIHILQRIECTTDLDCDDQLKSTIDSCMENINKCTHETIVTCTDNDGYCPEFCSKYTDYDCVLQDKCELDSECDDNNPGTEDSCEGSYGEQSVCKYEPITDCKSGDDFCPLDCKNEQNLFGTVHDADCSVNNTCLNHLDCKDDDEATIDLCAGDGTVGRSCTNELTVECRSNDYYCPEGCSLPDDPDCFEDQQSVEYKESVSYEKTCSEEGKVENKSFCESGTWKFQKAGDSSCSEDYQCQLGACKSDGTCLSNEDISNQRRKLITSIVIAGTLALIGTYLYYLFKIRNKF